MTMQPIQEQTRGNSTPPADVNRYARVVAASKRARWNIDEDVIRGRIFDLSHKFLPDGLSWAHRLEFLDDQERTFFSQVQGRTYANIFGLVERFINAKVLELSRHHLFGDQIALEALVRFSDEELKHQELFRRVEVLAGRGMPDGYHFAPSPNDVAGAVLSKSTWSVLALTCLIELFTQTHYKQSIATDERLSPLFKDVFRFHWMEESQHAVLDELEWLAEDARIGVGERRQAATDLIELVGAVDSILQLQAANDARYFIEHVGRRLDAPQQEALGATFLAAYRYQYILSGIEQTRFPTLLQNLLEEADFKRIVEALEPLT
jgi:hypothetical protein